EPAPAVQAKLGEHVVVVGTGGRQHQQRCREKAHEGHGQRHRQRPPAGLDCSGTQRATSLLKRSIHPARSGLIVDQSCWTMPDISDRSLSGSDSSKTTSEATGAMKYGAFISCSCTGADRTVSM